MFFLKKKSPLDDSLLKKIDMARLPKHIAIIMDGNGRWAKKRGLPRTMGHRVAVETIKEIVRTSSDIGIKYLTLYTFSTENWKRPIDEVEALMNLLVEYLTKELEELKKEDVIINYIGDITKLPKRCQDILLKSHSDTVNNKGLVLNLALNYGSRNEIKDAIKAIITDVESGEINIQDIDDKLISSYLYTSGVPDPDLLIRSSGEYRLSNFLLWQLAYTEFWFSDIYWPDFKSHNLFEAIVEYQNRDRRYGAVK